MSTVILSTPADARVVRQPGSTLVATANKEFEYLDKVDSNLEVVYLPAANGTVDLLGLMENLSQREINDVLVEAGPILSGSMLKAGLVDEVLLYLAPKFLGTEARGMFSLPGLQSLREGNVCNSMCRMSGSLALISVFA